MIAPRAYASSAFRVAVLATLVTTGCPGDDAGPGGNTFTGGPTSTGSDETVDPTMGEVPTTGEVDPTGGMVTTGGMMTTGGEDDTGSSDGSETGEPPPDGGPDIDGDGITDIVFGARSFNEFAGITWVGYGTSLLTDGPDAADVTLTSSEVGSNFGFATTICDIDGNGAEDILVGGLDGVEVYFGGDGGIGEEPDLVIAGVSFTTERGLHCGDLTGDGLADLIGIGSSLDGWLINVLPGSDGLIDESAIDIVTWADAIQIPGTGASLFPAHGVGDVNGDGYTDVIIGAPFASMGGQLYLYLGGPTLTSTSTPDVTVDGEPGSDLGTAVSVADVDGDGMADALAATNDSARIYSFIDSDLGLRAETTFGEAPRVTWATSTTMVFSRASEPEIVYQATIDTDATTLSVCQGLLSLDKGFPQPIDPRLTASVGDGQYITVSGPTDPITFQPTGPGGVMLLPDPADAGCTEVPIVDGEVTLGGPGDYTEIEPTDLWEHDDAHNVLAATVQTDL